jgi:hypothetical protein
MDILWAIGLIVLIAADVIVLGPALSKGNPNGLFQFYNTEGVRCGTDKGLDYPITYVPDMTKFNVSYCVDTCPSAADAKIKTIGAKDVATIVPSNLMGRLCIPKEFNMVQ